MALLSDAPSTVKGDGRTGVRSGSAIRGPIAELLGICLPKSLTTLGLGTGAVSWQEKEIVDGETSTLRPTQARPLAKPKLLGKVPRAEARAILEPPPAPSLKPQADPILKVDLMLDRPVLRRQETGDGEGHCDFVQELPFVITREEMRDVEFRSMDEDSIRMLLARHRFTYEKNPPFDLMDFDELDKGVVNGLVRCLMSQPALVKFRLVVDMEPLDLAALSQEPLSKPAKVEERLYCLTEPVPAQESLQESCCDSARQVGLACDDPTKSETYSSDCVNCCWFL